MPRKNRTTKTAAVETLAQAVAQTPDLAAVAAAIEPTVDPIPEIIPGEPTPIDPATGELVGFHTTTVVLPVENELPEVLTPAEIDMVQSLEAEASTNPVQEPQAEAVAEAVQSLEDALAAITEDAADAGARVIAACMDDRAAYETAKNGDNLNIQRTLKKARAQLATKRAARLLAVASVSPAFMNREIHAGARYNVYALGKLADVVYGVTGGVVGNAINLAILKSMFRCKAAGIPFTGELAKAAASDKIKVEGPAKTALVRHNVDSGTAPTQASSTMTALETLGVVSKSGSARAPLYELRDTPLTRKLHEVLMAA